MKLCDIVQFHSALSGGVKRYVHAKMAYLAQVPDVEHIVIVPSERDAVSVRHRTRVYEIRSLPLIGSRSYRMLLARRRIRAIVESERPDVIEVDAPYRSAWNGLAAARAVGAGCVAFYHSDYPRAIGRTLRAYLGVRVARGMQSGILRYLCRLYNAMDATVVSSQRFAAVLQNMGVTTTVRIPLGTDTSVFHPRGSRTRIRAELGLADGTALLLYAGRLAREKNIRALLDAAALLPGLGVRARLALVGDGELVREVQRAAEGREDLVWLGYCETSERLAELYSAADLVVHAGTVETFGLVSLEAQACGTRVMVVRGAGAIEETVLPEDAALAAADATPDGLAAGIVRALAEPDTPALRQARVDRIRRGYESAQTYARLLELYRRIAREKRAARAAAEAGS